MLRIILLQKENRHLITNFLQNAGEALQHFRYFKTRSLDVLDNHLATYLIEVNTEIVGYGHLDQEGGIVWLGIAISDEYQGLGLGKLMMNTLLASGRIQKIDAIRLSVDHDNKKAIGLYHKIGFITLKETEEVTFMKISL